MADISLVSRVRTRRKNSQKHGKNSKKTTRRATSAIWRISETCTIEDELNIDGSMKVSMF